MSSIKLVQGDNLPVITLTLTDATTGNVIDVSDSTTTVVVKLRAATGTTVLSTFTCAKTNGGADGVVSFSFPTPTLTVPAGQYQGEIEMNFNGLILTVFDLLQFTVRAQF
jgi:hypothetical protein